MAAVKMIAVEYTEGIVTRAKVHTHTHKLLVYCKVFYLMNKKGYMY